uniref:ABC transporter ATP-binding protein n=1 Tax=Desulfatirhabdium butyrativorans TaxID=340467 RepID=A0A7C4RTU1_9BACT
MIDLENICKRFGSQTAVDRLNLTVKPGEVFGFIGPNGAGKTTTIRMMAGVLMPTEGRIRICGWDMAENPIAAKRRIGFIPDRPYLYEKLTATELLQFIADIYGVDAATGRRRAGELLERFRLSTRATERIEAFSHGMKQRLVMCAALLHDPEVIVVDEPMVGLDPQGIKMVRELFQSLAADGKTVFVSTHTLPLAQDICHRIGIIHQGKLLALGTMNELERTAGVSEADLEQVFFQLTESQ